MITRPPSQIILDLAIVAGFLLTLWAVERWKPELRARIDRFRRDPDPLPKQLPEEWLGGEAFVGDRYRAFIAAMRPEPNGGRHKLDKSGALTGEWDW